MKAPILYVITPCFNEEDVLPETSKRLLNKIHTLIHDNKISKDSLIVFIDDGSQDKTWDCITELHKTNHEVAGIKLSRNRGHQNALLAGLDFARTRADVAISLDADLQDDINAMDEMLSDFADGNDIVYGVRDSRSSDSSFKRLSALSFYKIMQLLGVDSVYNHADYRLTSRRVLEKLSDFHEVNLYLRGIFPLIGFKTAIVKYNRSERFAGKSKYPIKKMLSFAIDGITSFSVKPLRFITSLGMIIFTASIASAIYLLIEKVFGATEQGLTFIGISIWFIGGVQMLCIGVVGEYIGKIYSETKSRPRFIIESILNEKK